MNIVNQGKASFLLALIRHIALIIPVMLLMNRVWSLDGLMWSQLAAEAVNAVIASVIFSRINNDYLSQKSIQCCLFLYGASYFIPAFESSSAIVSADSCMPRLIHSSIQP